MRLISPAAILLVFAFAPTVAPASQNVVVLVDDSGSMMDSMRSGVRRIQAAKDALKVVLGQLPADARVGVLALNQGWIFPPQPVDYDQMSGRIDQLRASGGTFLGENLKLAADELLKVRKEQVYGDYRLLIVTDGEANDQRVLDFVLGDVMARGITVDVIGVDMNSDHSLATKVHNYRRADDAATLQKAIAESLAESAADDTDTNEESDFELIASLPPDLAMNIIQSLTTAKNSPVGESDFQPLRMENDLGFDLRGNEPAGNQADDGGGFGLGVIICMGILFFGITTISSMLRAARRH